MLIGLPDATFGHCSHYHLHRLVLLLGFQVQVHPLFQLYLDSMFRQFWRRSEKEEPLLGEGNQKKASYGACDERGGVVDVEALSARGL